MINYKCINIENLEKINVDELYGELLEKKYQFLVIHIDKESYVLTKEKSLIKIDNIKKFIENSNKDIYYKTIKEDMINVKNDDLKLYKEYIDKYRKRIERKIYNNRYLFGSVAVKSFNNSFITTIRGKENLDEYALVNYVDHKNNIVSVKDKKASLNVPLLATLFENKKVKVIVHINHEYDDNLKYYEYAFPGTLRDSKRDNSKSFNIKNHGLFYLFDCEGELIV